MNLPPIATASTANSSPTLWPVSFVRSTERPVTMKKIG